MLWLGDVGKIVFIVGLDYFGVDVKIVVVTVLGILGDSAIDVVFWLLEFFNNDESVVVCCVVAKVFGIVLLGEVVLLVVVQMDSVWCVCEVVI